MPTPHRKDVQQAGSTSLAGVMPVSGKEIGALPGDSPVKATFITVYGGN